ncbi:MULTISPECIES: FAD-dependent oxidoreductase [unclassified Streptomyces]|uniref:NAD(P)/FAD-dependent oxidoreductase n=1 Tax=unclassified Streptomyces TaxID=2593676 RepID=UPI002E82289C|nr:FAD-dependent oxidoreductase [Streptomyces sp. NBC_00569]WSE13397.1 FAD-dependent oxidoreductase [Streptomyces sp. NBC_01397]WUB97686.1 FAD-dependent oxidoreductase [Streptomyces sp. NBC_00569]
MSTIAVVGVGLAGVRAGEALRAQGHDGRLVMIGEEAVEPYDRPPLSKQVLLGTYEACDIALTDTASRAELDAEWLLGTRATAFDPVTRHLTLSDGQSLHAEGVVIATGARARTLSGVPELDSVHTLRTLDDARRLRDDLSRPGRVAVVGGGFIGAEVASAARALGHEVTIVEFEQMPLLRQLGSAAAGVLRRLHTDHGVPLVTGVSVTGLVGRDRVQAVSLSDGRSLPADVVVVGIGAVPNTEWLAGSGVALDNGVLTDEWCRTTVPGVVAAGDVAAYRCRGGRRLRIEHWTNARDMPATAARSLLATLRGEDPVEQPAHDPLPYVWSDQYDSHLQIAGRPDADDALELVSGSFDSGFVAVYRRDGAVTGVLAVDSPKEFGRLRRELRGTWATR